MTKKITHVDVLNSYKAAGQFGTLTAFAEGLGVSKQRLNQWFTENGTLAKPSFEWLVNVAVDYVGEWQGDMAVDMLKHFGFEKFIPCVCQTEVGDHGQCPKHGVVQVALTVSKSAEVMA